MKKKENKSESFWKDGLSIDETRFSLTAFMAVTGFLYVIGMHFYRGVFESDIPDIVTTLILGIVGVNAVKYGADAFQRKRENKKQTDYNEDDDYSHRI